MAQHIFTGSGAPAFTPTKVGQHYIDELNKAAYVSVGTSSSADWESGDASAVQSLLNAHIGDTANPHAVTKSQVGLSNVPNVDATDRANHTGTQLASTISDLGDVATENIVPITKGGTGQSNATAALNNLLPDQTSSSGKVLKTDGSNASWQTDAGGGGAWGTITGTLSDQEDLRLEHAKLIDGAGSYYFKNSASDLGGGILEMTQEIPIGGGFGISHVGVTDTQTLATFASTVGFPNDTQIPSGPLAFTIEAVQLAGTKVTKLYAEFYSRRLLGFDTLLGTSNFSQVITGVSAKVSAYATMDAINGLLATDRLVIVIKASTSGAGTNPDITLNIQGVYLSKCKFPEEPVTIADITGKQDALVGVNGSLFYQSAPNVISQVNNVSVNALQVLNQGVTVQPNNDSAYTSVKTENVSIDPLQNSPNDVFVGTSSTIELDPNSTGFNMGTSGNAAKIHNNYLKHFGTGNSGSLTFTQNSFDLGNGTDPIDVKGISYAFGFGNIAANVTLTGPLQGYGFQPSIDAAAAMTTASYVTAFYDNSNINCESQGHTSVALLPNIASIANNRNYTGINLSPNIPLFSGNSNFNGLAIGGNLGTFGTGSYNGINLNPTIASVNYAAGINVNMDNVTVLPGVKSSVTIQDLFYEVTQVGDNNAITIEYVDDVTAGSETASFSFTNMVVHIESGVSTANQVRTAALAAVTGNANITVTGVGSNPQTTTGPTNFAGGVNAGRKQAGYFKGDVEITGALTFGGALSIGALNSFGTFNVASGDGVVSVSTLITQPTIAANDVITGTDLLGVNTAALITIGDNASYTSNFLGLSALGLPAVLTMGTGSTADLVCGAAFALSLDGGATGGAVAEVDLCRALAIPNGVTSVARLIGYKMDLPFGDPSTTTWGFYESPGVNNYLAGNLLIGGTAGSDDTVTNSSVALEIKSTTKAFVLPRMTTTEKNALTAIEGMYVYDLTLGAPSYYDGTVWV